MMVIALMAPGAAAAAQVRDGTYSGKTGQHLAVSLTVKHAKVNLLRVRLRDSCGHVLPMDVGDLHARINSHHRFRLRLSNPAGVLAAAGRFSGRQVKGWVSW